MSGKNYNEPYEDELDRMRARRRKNTPARQRKMEEDSFDDGFVWEDLDEEYIDEDFDYLDEDEDNRDIGYGKRRTSSGYRNSRQGNSGYKSRNTTRNTECDARIHRNSGKSGKSAYGGSTGKSGKTGKKRRKRKVPVIFLAVLSVLLLFAGTLYAKRWMKDRDGYWNIAVFGVDSRDGGLEKGALADVQMIASINKKTGEIRLVSIYRDTYVQINDDGDFHKINEAYFKGGHKQALETLKRNLDIEVDDYATFNWKAVADGINILGGIDLEITESEFAYINSFITATVESTGIGSFQLEHPGLNHLDGVQAVAYSRLRLMDTDFNRTERQRKVVSLALEKAKQADFKTLSALTGVVLSEISTSVGVEDVIPLAKNVNRYYLGQTGGFPFAKTTAMVGKLDCVIPMTLESNVVFLHQFLFDQEGYQPSASVKKISGIVSERTGIYEEGKSAGADKNLSGTTGNSGKGGSSNPSSYQNSGSSGTGEVQNSPQTEAVNLEETTAPQEIEEETEVETESEKEDKPKEEDEGIEEEKTTSSGSSEESEPVDVEPLVPEETTLSQEQIMEGPGAVNPPGTLENDNINAVKPTEPPSQEIGPGFEQPENSGNEN